MVNKEQLQRAIVTILAAARNDIRANMESQGVNATGRTSESIRIEETKVGVRLVGGNDNTHTIDGGINGALEVYDTAPIPTLETGHAGGGVPKGFYYIIKQWSRDKGIQFAEESERQTFAYFVAQKIAREGTERHKSPIDVYTTVTEERAAEVKKSIKTTLASIIVKSIRE